MPLRNLASALALLPLFAFGCGSSDDATETLDPARADASADAVTEGDAAPSDDALADRAEDAEDAGDAPPDGDSAPDAEVDAEDAGSDASDAASAALSNVILFGRSPDSLSTPQVFRIDPDGKNEQQLTTATPADEFPQGCNDEAVLSPDGKTILFASGRDIPKSGGVQNPTLRMLHFMDTDGKNVRRVTANSTNACNEKQPRYSPDGQWIVFTMSCDSSVVPIDQAFVEKTWRVRVDGSSQEMLDPTGVSAGDTPVTNGAFSRDGETIFVIAYGAIGSDVWAVDAKTNTGTKIADLASKSRYAYGPVMTPPDGTVWFETEGIFTLANRSPQLEAMNADGSGRHVVLPITALAAPPNLAGVARDSDFALSPDGQTLVFATYADTSVDPATARLAVSATDGSNRAPLGSPATWVRRPSWEH